MVASFEIQESPQIGHYTALVWGETHYVGCGLTLYQNVSYALMPYRELLVCNYYPPGYWIGQPVYVTGQPGSACPHGHKDGLCIWYEEMQENENYKKFA